MLAKNKRGRPSAASLAVRQIEVVERQRPPHDLTDEEVEIWVAIVDCESADWFNSSTKPLLAQYCKHVIQARRISELIERATSDKDLCITDYDRLLGMQARETRALMTLASKMRISQQATLNQRGNKHPTEARKPWEG